MDSDLFYLHLDRYYCWRWYMTDELGRAVVVSPPFFELAEAQQAKRVRAMPLAA